MKLPQLPRFPVPGNAEPANDLGVSALDRASALNDCGIPALVDGVLALVDAVPALHPELPALVAGILVKESGVPALVHGELVNESGSRGMESGDLRILHGLRIDESGEPGIENGDLRIVRRRAAIDREPSALPRVSPAMPTPSPVALVTGGASGIGRALCAALAADGVTVIVADLDLDGARETVARIPPGRGRVEAERVDVANGEQVERLVQDAVSRHGRLDFMFNNAGVVLAGEVLDMTPEHWEWILGVNLHGVIHGTAAAYRVMAEQGFGHIVNTASAAGLMPSPMCAAYAATKHAVVGLSTSLRDEARPRGVKVSVACPVFVATPLFEHAVGLGVSLGEMAAPFLKYALSPERAARSILRGVRKNRGVILFPFSARILLGCYRYLPGFARLGGRRMVAAFRKARTDT